MGARARFTQTHTHTRETRALRALSARERAATAPFDSIATDGVAKGGPVF